jgi:hypothetical protein
MSPARKWVIAIGGFFYIGLAYIPLPTPTSIVFGITGGVMTLLMIFISLRWASQRDQLSADQKNRQ